MLGNKRFNVLQLGFYTILGAIFLNWLISPLFVSAQSVPTSWWNTAWDWFTSQESYAVAIEPREDNPRRFSFSLPSNTQESGYSILSFTFAPRLSSVEFGEVPCEPALGGLCPPNVVSGFRSKGTFVVKMQDWKKGRSGIYRMHESLGEPLFVLHLNMHLTYDEFANPSCDDGCRFGYGFYMPSLENAVEPVDPFSDMSGFDDFFNRLLGLLIYSTQVEIEGVHPEPVN